ncbi:hypothetical protein DL764_009922 [Monosporascus ibericus]|uniref:Uncharacterized protein n=1 Tax=Monosporascus ibericus TaxID=155417 RepID=A0A4V1X8U6_9PEZI|nr:hypothetical protein DL764_009922 [Monosporascus ibericus]
MAKQVAPILRHLLNTNLWLVVSRPSRCLLSPEPSCPRPRPNDGAAQSKTPLDPKRKRLAAAAASCAWWQTTGHRCHSQLPADRQVRAAVALLSCAAATADDDDDDNVDLLVSRHRSAALTTLQSKKTFQAANQDAMLAPRRRRP